MTDAPKINGSLIVLSSPSGGGKSTIARALMAAFPQLRFSVSATTRRIRQGEVDGREYFFISKSAFQEKIRVGDFVEHEEIYGDYYGTLKSEIEKTLATGDNMLFDVDVKGSLSIKRLYGDRAILIFIQPPSLEALVERLKNRNTETNKSLRKRVERITMEIEEGKKFDHKVVNDELQRAIDETITIVRSKLNTQDAQP
jgi:guanylate kinase